MVGPKPEDALPQTSTGTSGQASAEIVGGVPDPWLADTRPEVIRCRQAWQAAREENMQLEPPPPGITADQQRAIVVSAFENAIAMMPDAPPVPGGLLRIASLWMDSGLGPEEPLMALEAYERVLRGFPNTRYAMSALSGKAYTLWALHEVKEAREAWQKVLAYQLPANADPRWARQFDEARLHATMWLALLGQEDPAVVAVSPQNTSARSLGAPTQEQIVSQASLIVRTRVAGWEDGIIRHDVERVIYGDFTGRTLHVDYRGLIKDVGVRTHAGKDLGKDLGHEPTATELDEYILKEDGIEKGKEMIIYLIPHPAQPGQPSMYFHQMAAAFDAPPYQRLDDVENAIIRIIAEGSYLSPSFPQPTDILREHIRAADLIVRAQLVEVNETDSRWTVTDVIKGNAQEKVLILPHDLFRLRAEAVVRHKHRAKQPATEPSLKQQIAAEMKRLIQAELVPGRRAILFVSGPTVEGEAIRAHLRQRIYEDASGKRLDEAIRAIRDAESHKLPVDL